MKKDRSCIRQQEGRDGRCPANRPPTQEEKTSASERAQLKLYGGPLTPFDLPDRARRLIVHSLHYFGEGTLFEGAAIYALTSFVSENII
jgi:hypothetical protein